LQLDNPREITKNVINIHCLKIQPDKPAKITKQPDNKPCPNEAGKSTKITKSVMNTHCSKSKPGANKNDKKFDTMRSFPTKNKNQDVKLGQF
jgi:hypothetical protein